MDGLIEKYREVVKGLRRLAVLSFAEFTEGATYKKLGDVFDVSIGRTPPTKEPKWFDTKGVKWLSIKDMANDSDFISETSQYLTADAVQRFNIPIIEPGDVLLSFKLTVGRTAISDCRMCSNEAIACFKTKTIGLPEYLYCYFANTDLLATNDSTSSIGKGMNSTIVKNHPFPYPKPDMLKEFNRLILPCFGLMKIYRRKLKELTELKRALLSKYF